MYKPCFIDARLVVRLCINLARLKNERIVAVIHYLQAGALIWRFQICIDHPISLCSIFALLSGNVLPITSCHSWASKCKMLASLTTSPITNFTPPLTLIRYFQL